jgi:hypothetical protein
MSEALRILAEVLGITDSMADTKGQNRTVDDALGLTDALSKDEVKVLADSLGLTDETTYTSVILRILSDVLGVTDVIDDCRTE